MPYSSIPVPRTALAWAVYQYAMSRGTKTPCIPDVADMMTWRFDNKPQGHEAQVYEVHTAGWVVAISYNSPGLKNGNEREGDGVWLKWYNWKHPLGRLKFRGFVGFARL